MLEPYRGLWPLGEAPMRRFAIALLGTAASLASAAGTPVQAPVLKAAPPASVYSWTGC